MPDGVSSLKNIEDKSALERIALLRRLVDVVALPASAGGLQDRAIAGDILLEMLIESDEAGRIMTARRLAPLVEAPRRVLRFLAHDTPTVSSIILNECKGLDQSDLVNVVRSGTSKHRVAVAGRRDVGPCVADAITESGDIEAMEVMLANRQSQLSDFAVDRLVSESRDAAQLCSLMLQRPELRPAHALVMFWWVEKGVRIDILKRFSAERNTLIEACSDIFAEAARENWSDPTVRKGLQVIERRQRNRAALERSDFKSLEDAIVFALKEGLSRELMDEICYLCGIKPLTGAKIFADDGGEGVAVLCKAVGLKRQYFKALWSALKRPIGRPNDPDPRFLEVLEVFEMMAVAKAQTVVRYWNWSLSAAFSPEILNVGDETIDLTQKDAGGVESHTRKSMRLIFGRS
ncbi:MAG: hypothetical protein CME88_07625 [Hirschia sp.]|nr:hypothetical protein [Hirschia sp.]MBF18228.1 hypothetical protein [Hirschia sp.]|tara:strand:+ start:2255 stop:3469 length:1215 start_codon:yes stop_codon:yes gene_type:complete